MKVKDEQALIADALSRGGNLGPTPQLPALSPEKAPEKPSKYRAKKVQVDGITFASKKEAARYVVLRLMERNGEISGLELQPRFPLIVDGVEVAVYVADFRYVEDGATVVEDVKSPMTRKLRPYRMKKKLMLALHGIEIRET
jgi:hypothetical protein